MTLLRTSPSLCYIPVVGFFSADFCCISSGMSVLLAMSGEHCRPCYNQTGDLLKPTPNDALGAHS